MKKHNEQILKELESALADIDKVDVEYCFFESYVDFELYLIETFYLYATGKIRCRRKIFISEIEDILRLCSKNNYFELKDLLNVHDLFFYNSPFDFILTTSNIKSDLDKMKSIRNYLAHRSRESKKRYTKVCLNDGDYIPPNIYLKNKPKNSSDTFYEKFIKTMICIIEKL